MKEFATIAMLAVVVEALLEYAKSLIKMTEEKDKKPLAFQMGALGIGLLLCFLTGADFFKELGLVFAYPIVGTILTGIFLSRGSNYVSDLIGRLRNGAKETFTFD